MARTRQKSSSLGKKDDKNGRVNKSQDDKLKTLLERPKGGKMRSTKNWCQANAKRKIKSSMEKATAMRERSIITPKKPPKFSWIEEDILAGQGRPTLHNHIQFLVDNGFRYIVTLTMNKPKALQEYPGEGLTWVHIPIQDETPPTLNQMQEFVNLVEKAKLEKVAVSVHCAWGRGRTGTMLACYLAKSLQLNAEKAIEKIRSMRPGSIDTEKQITAVKEFVKSLKV